MQNKNYSSVEMKDFAEVNYLTTLIKVMRSVLFLLLLLPSVSILAQSQTYTNNGTFTVPAGVTSVNVQCWGGGGGGSTVTTVAGGGGGGGAYSSGNVTVVAGSAYNIVIGARGTSGVNGTNTTFNTTSIVAAGGASAVNNSFTGALGGSIAASVGTTKYAGGNAATGSANIAGGGGGGAGSTGTGNNATNFTGGVAKTINGGAGGAGRRLTSGNGGGGAVYGAGGGGAYSTTISRTGGTGGRGLAIVSWTCPTYSISSVSASGPICPNNRSTITLTSSAANLPAGVYRVRYNLGAPNAATGTTVAMTVTVPGTGRFNTSVLANLGATTITITSIASGNGTAFCTSAITTNNTAVITVSNIGPIISVQPTSQAACIGTATSLSVTSPNATSYQWRRNGANIAGATASVYNIASYTSVNAGAYSVNAISSCGTITSATVYVTTRTGQPAVTANTSAAVICAGANINLTASTTSPAVTLLSESFNAATNTFTTTNSSTGGTVANAAFTLRANGYTYSGTTFNSNDNSQFYLSNSAAQGTAGTTATLLQSPAFSTQGLSAASLTFYHYYRLKAGAETAKLEISTNGSTWTTLSTYTSTQGARNSFSLVTLNLAAYLNQPLVFIRFKYNAAFSWYWAIDNVNISGTLSAPSYLWTSMPAGFTASLQNPTGVVPATSTIYTVAATNGTGCSSSATASVTVNNLPAITTQPTAPLPTCSGSSTQTISVVATGTGLTYSWRKAGVAVINGGVINGQGTATLTLTNPIAANTGSYDVVIAGTCAPTVTSAAVTVSLNTATAITSAAAPASQTVLLNGTPINLSLTATGTSLTYQWYSNNTNCNTCGTSVGSANGGQTNTYTTPTNVVGTKYYYCVITGTCGVVRTTAVSVVVTNSNTWAGGGTSNWNTPVNWTSGIVPSIANDVVIPTGSTPYPVLSSSTTVNSLIINADAFVSIGANTLTVNGAVSGTGTITGSDVADLVIGGAAGTIKFTTGSTNNYLRNCTINTGASATLGNALNISGGASANNEGTLTVSGNAVLTTGGFLTIKSNSFGTARVAPGNTAGGYISGDVTVERYIPQNAGKGWRLLASNTSGQTINAAWQEAVTSSMINPNPGFGMKITSSGANLAAVQALGFDTLSLGKSIFKYNQSNDMLEFVPNTNSTQFNSEQGYFIFIRGDRSIGGFGAGAPTASTVLRSKGTLFQGDQSAVNLSAGQYAMVRNPYASRLDVRQVTTTGGVAAAFQVWDPKLTGAYGGGAFQTFTRNNLTGNYEVSPGGGGYGANGSVQNYIESGSAFYMQATGIAGTVQVLESSKASGSQVAAFRPTAPQSANNRILFTVSAINPASTDVVDGGFIDFNDAYSNSVDVFDVRKNQNFNENFGIVRSNTELVVERRQAVTATDTVFFKMYNMRQTSYQIDIETNDFDTLLITAELQDQYTGLNTALNLSGVNTFTFTVSAAAASRASDRFKILLHQAIVLPVTFTSIKATNIAKKIAVEWKVSTQVNVDRYEVEKSVNGRLFSKVAVIAAGNNTVYNWLDENAVIGSNFYRVKAVDKNGYNNYSAITKISLARHEAAVFVFPKLVQNGIINVRLNNQSQNEYAVQLITSSGQTIFKTKIKFAGDEVWHKIELPSTVAAGVYELVLSEKGVLAGTMQVIIDKH